MDTADTAPQPSEWTQDLEHERNEDVRALAAADTDTAYQVSEVQQS